jgi:hypothetical protein
MCKHNPTFTFLAPLQGKEYKPGKVDIFHLVSTARNVGRLGI